MEHRSQMLMCIECGEEQALSQRIVVSAAEKENEPTPCGPAADAKALVYTLSWAWSVLYALAVVCTLCPGLHSLPWSWSTFYALADIYSLCPGTFSALAVIYSLCPGRGLHSTPCGLHSMPWSTFYALAMVYSLCPGLQSLPWP